MSTKPGKKIEDQSDDSGLQQSPPSIDISAFPPFQDMEFSASTTTGSGSPGADGTGAIANDTVTHPDSGLVFVNTYGSGVSTAFHNEIIAAETYLETHFTNSVTINASFDLQSLSHSFSGENSFSTINVSYATLVNALQSHATSPDDLAAVAALESMSDPSGGQSFSIPLGEARVLGLAGAGSGIDDSVILNNFYWTASALQNDPTDAEAVLMHELSEGAMGRIGGLWGPMDLFRYTASGQHDYTGGQDGQPTYFSTNGANVNTGLQFHNPINSSGQDDGFDWADWDQVGTDANAHDPFGPGGPGAGDPGTLSPTDIRIMDVLGWTRAPAVKYDFYGVGTSDILWQSSSGAVTMNEMQGSQVIASAGIGGGGAAGFSVVGSGDFNGDFNADLLWKDNTGAVTMNEMNGSQAIASAGLGGGGSAGWAIAGTGDFNGDGKSDILWVNNTGAVVMDEMNGSQVIASAGLGGGGSAGWSIAGTGDFNGDGKSDILWVNNTGAVVMDEMNGSQVIASASLGGGGSAGWSIAGTGDFNGDGKSDILWVNNTGAVVLDEMNGSQVIASAGLGGGGSAGWAIAATGDYNGDGMTDILWKNNNNLVVMNEMNGPQVIASATLTGSPGSTVLHS